MSVPTNRILSSAPMRSHMYLCGPIRSEYGAILHKKNSAAGGAAHVDVDCAVWSKVILDFICHTFVKIFDCHEIHFRLDHHDWGPRATVPSWPPWHGRLREVRWDRCHFLRTTQQTYMSLESFTLTCDICWHFVWFMLTLCDICRHYSVMNIDI